MSEPRSSDYRDVQDAEEQLGGVGEQVVEPVEETPEMAAAVEDDTALTEPPDREGGEDAELPPEEPRPS